MDKFPPLVRGITPSCPPLQGPAPPTARNSRPDLRQEKTPARVLWDAGGYVSETKSYFFWISSRICARSSSVVGLGSSSSAGSSSFFFLACFLLYPFCKSVVMSFTNWNGMKDTYKFVGLQNYIDLFNNKTILFQCCNKLSFPIIHIRLRLNRIIIFSTLPC